MFQDGWRRDPRDHHRSSPRREVHFALENDGWNCTFECEVHISAPGAVRGGRRHSPRTPFARRSARCGRRPARGAPSGGPRRHRMSKSATKARIEPERAQRIVDIPRFCSRPIPARGAFAADFDTPPLRIVTGVPSAPSVTRPPIPPHRADPPADWPVPAPRPGRFRGAPVSSTSGVRRIPLLSNRDLPYPLGIHRIARPLWCGTMNP